MSYINKRKKRARRRKTRLLERVLRVAGMLQPQPHAAWHAFRTKTGIGWVPGTNEGDMWFAIDTYGFPRVYVIMNGKVEEVMPDAYTGRAPTQPAFPPNLPKLK